MSTSAPVAGQTVELQIGGMTCASCANRIERKLNKLDGVAATVNYATEKASVTVPSGYDPGRLIAEVEKTGYTAALPVQEVAATTESDVPQADPELTALRTRLPKASLWSSPISESLNSALSLTISSFWPGFSGAFDNF